jgi:hypothetical protein
MSPRRRFVHRLAGAVAGAALSACGGSEATPDGAVDAPIDAPAITADDYAGLWLITELALAGDDGPQTLRRDGVAEAIRGDARFAATGETTGTLEVRQVLLREGLIASPIFVEISDVTIESDRWLVRNTAEEVVVFTTALVGDHLVLTHDPSDPRDTAPDPPDHVIVDRIAPWTSDLVGAWDLVTITIGETTRPANTCVEVAPGTTWAMLTMDIDIDARLLFTRVMTTRTYSDEGCLAQTGEESSTQSGYAESQPGALRIWGIEGERAEYQEFAVGLDGDTATLSRGACLPLPECQDEAPTEVVIERD